MSGGGAVHALTLVMLGFSECAYAWCITALVPQRRGDRETFVVLPLCRSTLMSDPLKTYRVYCFDGIHKDLTADLIEAADDEDAIAQAEAAGFGTKCEIWDGNRLVAELGPERRSA